MRRAQAKQVEIQVGFLASHCVPGEGNLSFPVPCSQLLIFYNDLF